MDNVSKFPSESRTCSVCRVPLRHTERDLCDQCATGHDFLTAATAFLATQQRRRPSWRRWAR